MEILKGTVIAPTAPYIAADQPQAPREFRQAYAPSAITSTATSSGHTSSQPPET
jgi:hypothetical protein